jgi:hypothetical protein
MTPLYLLGGHARAQLQIASVEERVLASENNALRRTKDMPGRYQHYINAANRSSFPKWQWMLDARPRQTDLHQARCALGNDYLPVRRDVVTMRMGYERETFCVPRVQPEILLRQVNTALVANLNHAENYFAIRVSSIARLMPITTVVAR